MNQCECQLQDGEVKLFCQRHQCTKYRRGVELCQSGCQGEAFARDYWLSWEQGRGLGQVKQKATAKTQSNRTGVRKCKVGNVIKRLIKEEYEKWKLPPPKGCMGCGGRVTIVNQWSCEECRERLEEIVNLLMTGAKEQKWIRHLVSLFSGTATDKAREIALRAIEEEEKRMRSD